jgi:hypothetical protein
LNNEADFIYANWDTDRCKVVECLAYITETRHGFLAPLPGTKPFYRAFAGPFSTPVWLLIATVTFVTGLILQTNQNMFPVQFTWFRLFSTLIGQDLETDVKSGHDNKLWRGEFGVLGTRWIAG